MRSRKVRGCPPGNRARAGRLRATLAGSLLGLSLVPALAGAAVDETLLVNRVSGLTGTAANGNTGPGPAVSADGRFVAFSSSADNLSTEDDDSVRNVYLRDTRPATGEPTTTLISRASGASGAAADSGSYTPAISDDGRFVAFASAATNLSDADTAAAREMDVFVRDTLTNATTLVSRAGGALGAAGEGDSSHPSISGTGAQVAFESLADNLTSDNAVGTSDIFVRDLAGGSTTLVSRAQGGNVAANGDSHRPSISANGQRVAFESDADNLSADDDDAVRNIYVREQRFLSTYHASRTTSIGRVSTPANRDSRSADLSADGSVVVFTSHADLAGAGSTVAQVFKRKLTSEQTSLVSRTSGADGAPGDRESFDPEVSGDGRYVAFISSADNLSDVDGGAYDVFARDTQDERTALVSRASGGGGAGAGDRSLSPAIASNGLHVAFLSEADNLSADDGDRFINLFMRELAPGLPAPVVLPDLGGGGGHGHPQDPTGSHAGTEHLSGTEHASGAHPSGGHAGGSGGHAHSPSGAGVRLRGGILFGSRTQDVDELFVFVTIHERGRIVLGGQVRVPGRASRSFRFRTIRRALQPHLLRKVRLVLPRRAMRSLKRTLRNRRLKARIKLTAIGDSGKRQVARRTIKLRP